MLFETQAVPGEELVGNREAHVAKRQIVDEAPVGPVEQGHGREARRVAEPKRSRQEVQRQTGIDDVLDDDDVSIRDRRVEILEQSDAAVGTARIRGELDQVDPVQDRQRAREIGQEDRARLEGRDEERLKGLEIRREEPAELCDTGRDLLSGEVDLPDRAVRRRVYEASLSWYRCARRSISRR